MTAGADALFAEAFRLHQAGRLLDADSAYRAVIAAAPGHADAHHLRGVVALQGGDWQAAADLIAKADALNPGNAAYLSNLSYALTQLGRTAEALTAAERAAALNPSAFEAQNNLGVALQAAGRREDAAAAYGRAAALNPGYAQAHNNLASALHALGRYAEAADAGRRAVAADPGFADAHNTLGAALQSLGRAGEAITAYEQALAIAPDNARFLDNLGGVLFHRGDFPEAAAAFEQAVAREPSFAKAHSDLLYTHSFHGVMRQEEILALARRFQRQACPRPTLPPRRIAGAKLKVGVASAEIGQHAVSCFLESYLRHRDPVRVDLTLYETKINPGPRRAPLLALADRHRDLSGLDDAEAHQVILRDGIDILVDTTSHLPHNRLPLLARRCAPIQAHYIGYHGTSGIDAMDYIIGDAEVTPPEFHTHFSETIFRLPRLWMAYHPRSDAPEPRAPAADYITFGNFNTLAKASAPALTLWARVLAAIPGSRLLLKDNPDRVVSARVIAALTAQGVDAARIEFLPWVRDWPEHMALYNRIDLALDSFPLNSGTTGFDALFMATPLVARRGAWIGGRNSSSVLKALGYPEWIADTDDDYVAIVQRLTADLPRLRAYKTSLRAEVMASPLCDGASLAAALEDAFAEMAATHNAHGMSPSNVPE